MHKVTLRVDDALHQRLKEAAQRDGRSLNREILWLAEDHLNNPGGQPVATATVRGITTGDAAGRLLRQLREAGFPVVTPGEIEAEIAEDLRRITGAREEAGS